MIILVLTNFILFIFCFLTEFAFLKYIIFHFNVFRFYFNSCAFFLELNNWFYSCRFLKIVRRERKNTTNVFAFI